MSPEIFISYAWGEQLEETVNKLYDNLQSKQYNIIRDKINLGYRGNIRSFMQRIGAGKGVIIVLSKKYLESRNCMYEALQVRENGNIEERIFPIVLSDANIYDPVTRLRFRKYWDHKIAELNQEIKTLADLSYLPTITAELDLYSDIRRFIDDFMGIVANMNVLTPDIHSDSDFTHITSAIDDLFRRDGSHLANV